MNQQFQFKSNIKCAGCIATVQPHFDQIEGMTKWSVDTTSPDKLLTVEANKDIKEALMEAAAKAGYHLDPLNH